jgi:hypothetical protein
MKDLLLLLYYPFIKHVLEFIFSKEWSLKWYSITFLLKKFKSIYIFKRKRDVLAYIIEKRLRLNLNLFICTTF